MTMKRVDLSAMAMVLLPQRPAPGAQQRRRLRRPGCTSSTAASIKGLDPALFTFKKEELAEIDFVVTCYLIVHPKGTLMWDVGVIPDSAFKADGQPVTEGMLDGDQAADAAAGRRWVTGPPTSRIWRCRTTTPTTRRTPTPSPARPGSCSRRIVT